MLVFTRDVKKKRKIIGVLTYARPDSMLFKVGLSARRYYRHHLSSSTLGIILTGLICFECHVSGFKERFQLLCRRLHGREMAIIEDLIKRCEQAYWFELSWQINSCRRRWQGNNSGIKVYTGSKTHIQLAICTYKKEFDKIILASDNIWLYYNLEHLKSEQRMARLIQLLM